MHDFNSLHFYSSMCACDLSLVNKYGSLHRDLRSLVYFRSCLFLYLSVKIRYFKDSVVWSHCRYKCMSCRPIIFQKNCNMFFMSQCSYIPISSLLSFTLIIQTLLSTHQIALTVRCKPSRHSKKVMKMYGLWCKLVKNPKNLWKYSLSCYTEVFCTIFFKTMIIKKLF